MPHKAKEARPAEQLLLSSTEATPEAARSIRDFTHIQQDVEQRGNAERRFRCHGFETVVTAIHSCRSSRKAVGSILDCSGLIWTIGFHVLLLNGLKREGGFSNFGWYHALTKDEKNFTLAACSSE
ncbi:uncharacterized protein G2W53_025970 [Senna tora]|uniref:Uncharacterized protein n=1 Tax=Senna tora TaxID=362788 RepID=A0A834TEX0_9FABA|nr:uncharacterized protein G2W53_025970 [Senna tora]